MADTADQDFKDGMKELAFMRDEAGADADRAEAAIERLGPGLNAGGAESLRAEDGSHRREHVRAVPQRIEDERDEAAQALRARIDRIVLEPGPKRGEVPAPLYGGLETILAWAEDQGGQRREAVMGFPAGALSVAVNARAGVEVCRWTDNLCRFGAAHAAMGATGTQACTLRPHAALDRARP